MLALCRDERVLGAPFYVMGRVGGVVARGALPAGFAATAAERRAIADALVEVLAALHAVEPAAVGLADFGHPDGYLERQLRRWSAQWAATRSHELPALDALLDELRRRLPRSGPATVVHGDYRLDNTVLDPADPGRIRAVLDWEMSTLGDPLADVGLLLVYWTDTGVVPTVTALPGFPSRDELAASYARVSGRRLDTLSWYVAFGYLKLAVVCAGIAARHAAGGMVGAGFEGVGERVEPLVGLGAAALTAG